MIFVCNYPGGQRVPAAVWSGTYFHAVGGQRWQLWQYGLYVSVTLQCMHYVHVSIVAYRQNELSPINPLTPTDAIWVMFTAIKHPSPIRVKPSFVIFDIRALIRLSPERQSA